jgi:hypothetical protein
MHAVAKARRIRHGCVTMAYALRRGLTFAAAALSRHSRLDLVSETVQTRFGRRTLRRLSVCPCIFLSRRVDSEPCSSCVIRHSSRSTMDASTYHVLFPLDRWKISSSILHAHVLRGSLDLARVHDVRPQQAPEGDVDVLKCVSFNTWYSVHRPAWASSRPLRRSMA